MCSRPTRRSRHPLCRWPRVPAVLSLNHFVAILRQTARTNALRRSDYDSADAAIDGRRAEALRHRRGRPARGLLQARGIARLDLVAQRRALTVGDGDMTGRRRAAAGIDRVDGDVREACCLELLPDARDIV